MVNAQWFQNLAQVTILCWPQSHSSLHTIPLAAPRITLQSDSKVAAADAAEKAKLAEHAEQFEGIITTMHLATTGFL